MLSDRFLAWQGTLDHEKIAATRDRKAWVVMLTFFTLAIFVCSSVDKIHAFTNLQWQGPLICLGLVAIHAYITSEKGIYERLGPITLSCVMLSTSLSFQVFMWSMVVYSGTQAAPMMAVLPILLGAYHAELLHLSTKHLWYLIPLLGAIIIALFLSPTSEHITIVLIGSLFAVAAAFTMGNYAVSHASLVKERNGLREAFEAQNLMESVNETEKAKDLLHEMMGTNHDAGNALTGVLMNIDLLNNAVKEHDEDPGVDIKQVNEDIYESVYKLKSVIEKGRDVGRQAHLRETVNVKETLEHVVKDINAIFQDRDISLHIEDLGDAAYIGLHGGTTTFSRILTNLLKNACEGDGTKVAKTINLKAYCKNGQLVVDIKDDGPGFKQSILDGNISLYNTSKSTGTGLGLYTTKRLAKANDGKINLRNNDDRGALVSISLPIEKAA